MRKRAEFVFRVRLQRRRSADREVAAEHECDWECVEVEAGGDLRGLPEPPPERF